MVVPIVEWSESVRKVEVYEGARSPSHQGRIGKVDECTEYTGSAGSAKPYWGEGGIGGSLGKELSAKDDVSLRYNARYWNEKTGTRYIDPG